METLPRKEAIRTILGVLNKYRKHFPANYNGHHRSVATRIIDKCETLCGNSSYKSRFLVEDNNIFLLKKSDRVARIDLTHFSNFLEQGSSWSNSWERNVGSYDWSTL